MAASTSASEAGSMMASVALECGGDISASQEDALATSPFLGAGGGDNDHDEEAFDPPQQQQEEDTVTMCTLPSTSSPTRSPSPAPPSPRWNRKPRVCVRKVRGAKIRTPTPSPDLPPEQAQKPETQQPPEPQQQQQTEQQRHADPLYRAVLMVGALTGATDTSSSNEIAIEDFLALACRRGLL